MTSVLSRKDRHIWYLRKTIKDLEKEKLSIEEKLMSSKKEEDYWKRRYIARSIKLRENIDVKEIIQERDIIQHEYEKELEKNRILNQRVCFSDTQEHGYVYTTFVTCLLKHVR